MNFNIKALLALALLALLLVGCTQSSKTKTTEIGKNASPSAPITSSDIDTLENPDSESMDSGIPLEEI